MKKIWLSMFYSIRVGEEPDLVFLKNREIRTKSRWYGSTPLLAFLRQRSYHFRSNWSYIYFSISIQRAKIYLRGKDDSFGSTWESNSIELPESMLYIWKRRISPRSTETKCRTGTNSSSRKKGLTEPGSLTNTNLILTNPNLILIE